MKGKSLVSVLVVLMLALPVMGTAEIVMAGQGTGLVAYESSSNIYQHNGIQANTSRDSGIFGRGNVMYSVTNLVGDGGIQGDLGVAVNGGRVSMYDYGLSHGEGNISEKDAICVFPQEKDVECEYCALLESQFAADLVNSGVAKSTIKITPVYPQATIDHDMSMRGSGGVEAGSTVGGYMGGNGGITNITGIFDHIIMKGNPMTFNRSVYLTAAEHDS
jgi:hypothetical protein